MQRKTVQLRCHYDKETADTELKTELRVLRLTSSQWISAAIANQEQKVGWSLTALSTQCRSYRAENTLTERGSHLAYTDDKSRFTHVSSASSAE